MLPETFRRKPLFPATLTVGLLLTVACTAPPAEPESTHRFVVTEEDGVTVARSTGGPKYEGEIFTYEKVLEIRPDDTRPETLFFMLAGRALDDEGNLYVVDANGNRISAFDSEGNWLRDIGRQGDGPGEFQYPRTVEYADGELRVPDSRRRGTHVFAPDGTFVEFRRWPEFQRLGTLVPEIYPAPDGRTVVRLLADSSMIERLEERPASDEALQRLTMLVFGDDGVETARATGPWVKVGEYRTITSGGRERRWQIPVFFAPQAWGGYVPGRGIWMTTGERAEIDWYDLDGRPTESWHIDLPVSPVTDEDRALVAEIAERQLREAMNPPEGGGEAPPPDRLRLITENLMFADSKPVWSIPYTDDYGYFWISSRMAVSGPIERELAMRDEQPPIVRVISPQGEYLGNTSPPAMGTFQSGHLLTNEMDPATQESFPVVYRIRPAVQGLVYGR